MKLIAYPDTKNWAICYGDISFEREITTKEDCDRRLREDLHIMRNTVKNRHPNLNIYQTAALMSFYYNVGIQPHLEEMLKSNYFEQDLRDLWVKYNRSNDIYIPKLKERRQKEVNFFFRRVDFLSN